MTQRGKMKLTNNGFEYIRDRCGKYTIKFLHQTLNNELKNVFSFNGKDNYVFKKEKKNTIIVIFRNNREYFILCFTYL